MPFKARFLVLFQVLGLRMVCHKFSIQNGGYDGLSIFDSIESHTLTAVCYKVDPYRQFATLSDVHSCASSLHVLRRVAAELSSAHSWPSIREKAER